jgi:hypothetical protein
MQSIILRLLSLTILACAAMSSPLAQDTAIQGMFVSTNTSKAPITQAIDAAIAKMNFLTRAVARSRLLDTNPLYERIEIANDGSQITVRYDKGKPVAMPADGSTVKWTRDDGEKFDVSAHAGDSQLQHRFKAEDGERLNEFSLSPDGTLTLNVTISSPQLPAPVKYALIYRRQ